MKILKKIKAREAFDSGLTRYFTGKKCKNNHIRNLANYLENFYESIKEK